MYLDLIKQINKHDIEKYNEAAIEAPLLKNDTVKFIKESEVVLQYTPCGEYIEFLQLTNGFEFDGHFIDNAEDFLFENIEVHKILGNKNFIVFGNSGNVDRYTYNKEDNTFNIANMFGLDDKPYKSFKTFGELIIGIFQEAYDAQLEEN